MLCLILRVIPSSTNTDKQSECIDWRSNCLSIVCWTRFSRKDVLCLQSSGRGNFSHENPRCTIFTGNGPASIVILLNAWCICSIWLNSCRSCVICINIYSIFIRVGKWCIILFSAAAGDSSTGLVVIYETSPLSLSQRFWILANACLEVKRRGQLAHWCSFCCCCCCSLVLDVDGTAAEVCLLCFAGWFSIWIRLLFIIAQLNEYDSNYNYNQYSTMFFNVLTVKLHAH